MTVIYSDSLNQKFNTFKRIEGLQFVSPKSLEFDLGNYIWQDSGSGYEAFFISSIEDYLIGSSQLTIEMKYFSLTTLSDGSQGFEQSSIEVLFENISESQCSRKCGSGVKVVHKGVLSFDESCEVTSCDLCMETDIHGSKCATWSALGLCVDDFIANECPITCCS